MQQVIISFCLAHLQMLVQEACSTNSLNLLNQLNLLNLPNLLRSPRCQLVFSTYLVAKTIVYDHHYHPQYRGPQH